MIRKFFPLDKNYLLEKAQISLQDSLLLSLVVKVLQIYEIRNNPLGLQDEMNRRIANYRPKNVKPLYGFYHNLAGVYRYKHGENQLEFLWDGNDHIEKYKADWNSAFQKWIDEFCLNEQFLLAVMDLTVFLPLNRKAHLAENRMNAFITQFFELKIHKSRGIIDVKVA